jgi:undecaprenyl pyrophosphate phosphatase UppP
LSYFAKIAEMEEENITHEIKEKIEEVTKHASWNRYLALTTAIIAVIAAIASLLSGSYANEALLQKNDAVLNQNKASDQWNYYQSKGIKKNLAESFYEQNKTDTLKGEISKYSKEQKDIQVQAQNYEKQVNEANQKSGALFEKHHQEALAVTFFQIAIALAAMSALLKRKSFWIFSILLALIGGVFFTLGVI